MNLLTVYLELVVTTLAAWGVAYEVVLYTRLPRAVLLVVFPALGLALSAAFMPSWWRRVRVVERAERNFALGVLLLGSLVAGLVLVTSRPDADDVPYLLDHLRDAAQPEGSLSLGKFRLPRTSATPAPSLPGLNRNPAYEALVVTVASAVGLDPLAAYHNGFAALAALTWTATYAALLRQLRVPRRWVVPALVLLLVLLLLDGNGHRSFGNMSLLRLWQGKVIVFAVLVPLLLLFSLRMLLRPPGRGLALVLLTAAAAVCMNRSALFLVPVLLSSVALAYGVAFGATRRRLWRAALLLLPAGAVLGLLVVPVMASPASARVVADMAAGALPRFAQPTTWWDTLRTSVLGNAWAVGRDALLLLLPLVCLRRPLNRFLPLLALVVCVLCFNPVTGPLWYRLLTGEAYWRLYYLLPLPLCFGLLVVAVRRAWPLRNESGRWLAALGAAAATYAVSFERSVLARENGVEIKSPREYRFRSGDLAFARRVAPLLAGRRVLAADPVANILALTQPTAIALVYPRAPFAFPDDPKHRADRVLSRCSAADEDLDAARSLLDPSVGAVIMRDCPAPVRDGLQNRLTGRRLVERVRANGFVMLEVEPNRP